MHNITATPNTGYYPDPLEKVRKGILREVVHVWKIL